MNEITKLVNDIKEQKEANKNIKYNFDYVDDDMFFENMFCDDTGYCQGSSCPNWNKCQGLHH